ncbi:MAG: helix-turn-helix transcriptional regulator [Promethearchaeota archaeon]
MSTRTPELKKAILKMAGKGEFYGYEIHKKLEQKNINIGIGRLYSVLSEMMSEGLLKDRWERSQKGPKKRIYRIAKSGEDERERMLVEAIKTVHEFYTDYLLSLPPKLSAFNKMADLLIEKVPKHANLAYAANRFSGPVRKVMEILQDKFPEGNVYAISSKSNGTSPDLGAIPVIDGSFEDIPMRDDYLQLLIVTGSVKSDCIDACLREWRRVLSDNGTLAIITPTALFAEYTDPLEIGEFVEQKEHPRNKGEDSLNLVALENELKKHFANVDVSEIVHITVLKCRNPIKK